MNRLFLLLFAAVTFVAHAQVPDYVPTEGLVGWWSFDGTISDASSSNYSGESYGTEFVEDRFGNIGSALLLDGIDDYVQIDGQTTINSFSISIWYKIDDPTFTGYGSLVHVGRDNGVPYCNGFGTGATGTPLELSAHFSCLGYISPNLSDNSAILNGWTHWVVVYSSFEQSFSFYSNGIHVSTVLSPFSESFFSPDPFIYLGCTEPGTIGRFKGNLDDFGLFNRALTACEIAALFAADSNVNVSVSAGADLSICSGDSIVLSASGGDSAYTWSQGIENGVAFVPDSSSYFTVEGSFGTCNSSDTVFVEVLQPTTGLDTQVVCDSLTWLDGITYTASTNEPSFALTNAAGCDSIVTLDLTVNYTTYNTIDTTVVNVLEYNGEEYTEGGEYLVYLENEAGCDSIVTIKLTVEYVGVDDLETTGAWSVYPNPIESQLTISSDNALESYLVQIFNALGQVIWSERVNNQITIEVDGWPRGMYVVEIQGEGVETRERMQIVLK